MSPTLPAQRADRCGGSGSTVREERNRSENPMSRPLVSYGRTRLDPQRTAGYGAVQRLVIGGFPGAGNLTKQLTGDANTIKGNVIGSKLAATVAVDRVPRCWPPEPIKRQ